MHAKNHRLLIMSAAGDRAVTWHPDDPTEVSEAKAAFEAIRRKGYMVVRPDKQGESATAVTDFDPSAELLVGVVPVTGG